MNILNKNNKNRTSKTELMINLDISSDTIDQIIYDFSIRWPSQVLNGTKKGGFHNLETYYDNFLVAVIIGNAKYNTNKNTDEALIDIHSKLRPGEPSTLDSAKNQLITRFFDSFRYDLAKVGRYKFNKKLNVVDRLFGNVLAENIIVDGEVVVPENTVFVATKEAVTCFVKKEVEVEQDRIKNKRINSIIPRKVGLVALTDATKAVKITKQG